MDKSSVIKNLREFRELVNDKNRNVNTKGCKGAKCPHLDIPRYVSLSTQNGGLRFQPKCWVETVV